MSEANHANETIDKNLAGPVWLCHPPPVVFKLDVRYRRQHTLYWGLSPPELPNMDITDSGWHNQRFQSAVQAFRSLSSSLAVLDDPGCNASKAIEGLQ